MEDFEAIYAAKVPEFEDTVAWPYLDTHQPPLVTVATGCQIGLAEAKTLPFTVLNEPVSPERIAQEYARVQAMPGGRMAAFYLYDGCLMLPEAAQTELLGTRLAGFSKQLRALFPTFDHFPVPAKVALLEMMFTLGWDKFYVYYLLRAAVARGDWKAAAAQCGRDKNNPAYDVRNAWTRLQFLAAAGQ